MLPAVHFLVAVRQRGMVASWRLVLAIAAMISVHVKVHSTGNNALRSLALVSSLLTSGNACGVLIQTSLDSGGNERLIHGNMPRIYSGGWLPVVSLSSRARRVRTCQCLGGKPSRQYTDRRYRRHCTLAVQKDGSLDSPIFSERPPLLYVYLFLSPSTTQIVIK